MSVRSGSKSLRGAGLCLRSLVRAVLGRSSGFERAEKASRNAGDFIDGSVECGLVWFRWLVEAAVREVEREPAPARPHHETRQLTVALPAGGSGAGDGAKPSRMAE